MNRPDSDAREGPGEGIAARGMENLLRRFLSIVGGKMATTVIALASTPVVVRLLGPARYGDYAVLLSVFSLYMIPVSAGVTEGVQKFVSERRARPHWREHVFRFYALLALGTVLVGASVLLAVTRKGIPGQVFGPGFDWYFLLLVAFVLVSQFRAVTYHTVLGFGLEPVSESLNVAKKLVTVLVGIGLVLLGYGVTGMLVGHIAANLLVAVAAGGVVARRLSLGGLLRWPESFPYRELLSFNGLNVLLVLLMMSLFHLDVVMVRTLTDSESTGLYKAALTLAEFLWFVPLALQVLLLHSSSSLWSEGRLDDVTALATRATRYSLLLTALMGVGLVALADRVVPLYYGASFAAATGPLLVLVPGVIGFAAARPLLAVSQGSGRLSTVVVGVGGAAFLNVGLNGLLIPRYGMYGAAVATSVAYGSMFVALVWAAHRIGFRPLADLRPLRLVATVLLSAPVIVLLERAISNDATALLVVPAVGAAVYGVAAVATGAVGVEECRAGLETAPAPVGSAVESGFAWVEGRFG